MMLPSARRFKAQGFQLHKAGSALFSSLAHLSRTSYSGSGQAGQGCASNSLEGALCGEGYRFFLSARTHVQPRLGVHSKVVAGDGGILRNMDEIRAMVSTALVEPDGGRAWFW